MQVLIIKLGATGDVVRTTSLLRSLAGEVTWLTEAKNAVLLQNRAGWLRCFEWAERGGCLDRLYDLVINLEDSTEVAGFLREVNAAKRWGAQLGSSGTVTYTEDSRAWFDLSIVSRFGRERADELKLSNRSTYQQLIFEGLGLKFTGESYVLPSVPRSDLAGDVAIAAAAGPVWPMKEWAYYPQLQIELEASGLTVNRLPKRESLLEHLADVRSHRCLVSGDSLPMHLALGCGVKCVSIFNCTSPWEIHGYGLQRKIVSPLLEEFFYRRGFEERATTAIPVSEVFEAVMDQVTAARAEGVTTLPGPQVSGGGNYQRISGAK